MIMIPGHNWLEEVSAALWPALADHILQATLIAAICFLVLPLFRRAGARARHTLWLVAFVRFAIPPVLVLFIADCLGFEAGKSTSIQHISFAISRVTQPLIQSIQPTTASDISTGGHSELYCLLTSVWFLGCLILLVRWWLQHHRFAISLRTQGKECKALFADMIEPIMKKLGMARTPEFRVISGNFNPGVWGVGRPVLVLPGNILQKLEAGEVEAILAHELVHLRQWDNLWSNLQMFLCCIFWFHPLVWILDRRLIAERERACDERVIEVLHNSRAYVSGLIKITGLGLGLQVNGASSMAGANLKSRIEHIMKNNMRRATGWHIRLLLFTVATFAILLYLFAVPLQQSLAQSSALKQAGTPVESKQGDSIAFQIENSQDSPLKIQSPQSRALELPREAIERSAIAALLAESGISIQNKSDHVINSFILEFKMPDASFYYQAGIPSGIAPNGSFTLGTEQPLGFFIASNTNGTSNVVRLAAAVFKEGDTWKLPSLPSPPAPAPPPSQGKSTTGGIAGGVVGGIRGKVNAPVPPPPPPQAIMPTAKPAPVPQQTGLKQADGTVRMNFKDLDLGVFIKEVSEVLDLTPLVVDSAVQGTVTVYNTAPMTKEEALALFNLVLKKNNASLIHQNGIYQINPISSP